jgi:hypothetical protein
MDKTARTLAVRGDQSVQDLKKESKRRERRGEERRRI